jgi:hypothetical protein
MDTSAQIKQLQVGGVSPCSAKGDSHACALQAGVLPKSCMEAEAKEVPSALRASLSFLTRRIALQICIEEQQGEVSSLLFSVDARADVKVNAPPPPSPPSPPS